MSTVQVVFQMCPQDDGGVRHGLRRLQSRTAPAWRCDALRQAATSIGHCRSVTTGVLSPVRCVLSLRAAG